jgi:hypothetical protein
MCAFSCTTDQTSCQTSVALLDPGCETSLISKELALVLKLTGERTKMNLKTFHGQDPKLTLTKTHCQISSTTNSSNKLTVNPLIIVPKLQVNERFINWKQHQNRWPNLKNVELSNFDWREVGIFRVVTDHFFFDRNPGRVQK